MNFNDLLTAGYKNPTVALFYGTYCAPCERLKPKLREVCQELGVRLESFNSSAEMPALRALGIRSVPAIVVVHKGVAKLAFTGDLDHQKIRFSLQSADIRSVS